MVRGWRMDSTSTPRVLVINPNTSQHMTNALEPAIKSLNYHAVEFSYFTSPTPGVESINSPEDAAESAKICLPHLIPLIPHHDAFLVACYSQHPLVPQLKAECEKLARESSATGGAATRKHVTGIFEASTLASLAFVGSHHQEGFGIVSTGKVWESALQTAVQEFLGATCSGRFLGCTTTGLNASELHALPPATVRLRMKDATRRLIQAGQYAHTNLRAICLGCAGMVGLEEAVREACIEILGHESGRLVAIVDGVKAGVGLLVSLIKAGI